MLAALEGNEQCVNALIHAGANINAISDDEYGIHAAYSCRNGSK